MHGYCNTLTSFFRMLAPLSKANKVYVIDLPGMGLSSRPEFTLQGAEPVVEYFVSWIESWRETLNIDRLIIAGHSFGGYIAGMYAAKYPERILNLHLISPIGITHVDRD
jgi:pimeloyl-ACP methyl ester carboxylesterase